MTAILDFIYDESGRPFALNYSTNGGRSFTTYYYILNLQGDVVKLVWYIPGFEYEAVAEYTYDAWGNLLSSSGDMAEINPLRYRGYYYDSETGFYYIKSRYYDPSQRRYLNADTVFDYDVGFEGYNLFVYCGNSPVFRIDVDGRDSEPSDDHEQILTNSTLGGGGSGGFTGGSGGCGGAAPTVTPQDEDRRDIDEYIQAKNARNANSNSSPTTRASDRGSSSRVPNPNGRRGGQLHQQMIKNIKSSLANKNFSVYGEHRVPTPNGEKGARYLDVFATNGSYKIGIQVGRSTMGGMPVAREMRALCDITNAGVLVIFVPYN